jgi:predicted outer membrane repeat protein
MKKRKRSAQFNTSYGTLEPRQLLATLTVDTSIDSLGDIQDGRISLREAIMAANTNAAYGDAPAGSGVDEIVFKSHLEGKTFRLAHGEMQIQDGVSIRGNLTIDARSSSRSFNIQTPDLVSIESLSFENGMAAQAGAILTSGNGNVHLKEVSFTNNAAISLASSVGAGFHAFSKGGAILHRGGLLTIEDSSFAYNRTFDGNGGAVYSSNGHLKVSDSSFEWGEAQIGASIYKAAGSMKISGSSFTNNGYSEHKAGALFLATPYSGGAISMLPEARGTIQASLFESNSAKSGGAISNLGGKLLIVDSDFNYNNAGEGGALSTSGRLNQNRIESTNFQGNYATHGGAISANNGTLNILGDSSLIGNLAEVDGGAIYAGGVSLRVTGGNVSSNSAERSGGGFSLSRSTLNVTSTDFSHNRAATQNIHLHSEVHPRRLGGGAIYAAVSNLQVKGDTAFSNNLSTGGYAKGGAIYLDLSRINMTGTLVAPIEFSGNSTGGDGTSDAGGAVYADGSIIRATYANFYENRASNGATNSGGGMALEDSRAYVFRSQFERNYSTHGGAFSVKSDSHLHVADSIFVGNYAQQSGGVIFVSRDSSTTVVRSKLGVISESPSGGIEIRGNYASAGSGGAIANQGNLLISNSEFTSNGSRANQGDLPGGGAIDNSGTSRIRGTAFRYNHASRDGGAILNRRNGDLFVDNTVFDKNTAGEYNFHDQGGAIYSSGRAINLSNSTFTGNSAESGGAIAILKGQMNVNHVTFGGTDAEDGNVAASNDFRWDPDNMYLEEIEGGAVYIAGPTTVSFSQTRFLSNSAYASGGAISIQATGDLKPTVAIRENTIFQNNFTQFTNDSFGTPIASNNFRGGAISNRGGDLNIRDSVFANNIANDNGGAIANLDDGLLTVRSVMLRDNESSELGGAIFNDATLFAVDSNVVNNVAKSNGGFADGEDGNSTVLRTSFVGNSV